MNKKNTAAFCASYIILTCLSIANLPYDSCASLVEAGVIIGAAGSIAIVHFLESNRIESNRQNINQFINKPSLKKAGNLLFLNHRKNTGNK